MPSIKQVLPTVKNKFVGATSGLPRAFNERPYITKGQRFFISVLFHTPCLARYSVLHLLGVLSGEDKPPLCKGRWVCEARRRDCKKLTFIVKQSLSHLRRQLPLHKGAFGLCIPKVSLLFLTSTAFVGTKAKPRIKRGKFYLIRLLLKFKYSSSLSKKLSYLGNNFSKYIVVINSSCVLKSSIVEKCRGFLKLI